MKIVKILLAIIAISVLATACAQQGEINPDSSVLPEKVNPKLDSRLNQLVRAEKLGQAAEFAGRNDIELINGNVRVIIECVPGQSQEASKAVTDAGYILESGYGDLLQAVVAVSKLSALAEAVSIKAIRLPQQPLQNTTTIDTDSHG